jgi:hypothetical protein
MSWMRDYCSQKNNEPLLETRTEKARQMQTTSFQAIKREKELIRIHNNRAKMKNKNQENNFRTKKMMMTTVIVIFD